MKNFLPIALLVSAALTLIGCGPTAEAPVEGTVNTAADIEAINSLRDEFVKVFNTHDATTMATLYTSDAVLMPPNEPAAVGNAAIQSWFQKSFEGAIVELTLSAATVEVVGDWAFERNSYSIVVTSKDAGEEVGDTGKSLVIHQRQAGGSWKLSHDIWNSDKPFSCAEEESPAQEN